MIKIKRDASTFDGNFYEISADYFNNKLMVTQSGNLIEIDLTSKQFIDDMVYILNDLLSKKGLIMYKNGALAKVKEI